MAKSVLLVVLCAFTFVAAKYVSRSESHSSGRIISGIPAKDGDVPYVAALHTDIDNCGAAILSDTFVLTTASCCSGRVPGDTVYYGAALLNGNGTNTPISRLIPHPNFTAAAFAYDICLIEVGEKIVFSKNTQPIKLPDPSDILPDGTDVSTAGWGNEFPTNGYEGTNQLYILPKLVVLAKSVCDAVGPNDFFGNSCAFPAENAGACEGDFGNPIVRNGTVYGLINVLQRYCGPAYPVIFANVPLFVDWIKENMNA